MSLNKKNKTKDEENNKIKIYDSYIYLIWFNIAIKSFFQSNYHNKIAESQLLITSIKIFSLL